VCRTTAFLMGFVLSSFLCSIFFFVFLCLFFRWLYYLSFCELRLQITTFGIFKLHVRHTDRHVECLHTKMYMYVYTYMYIDIDLFLSSIHIYNVLYSRRILYFPCWKRLQLYHVYYLDIILSSFNLTIITGHIDFNL